MDALVQNTNRVVSSSLHDIKEEDDDFIRNKVDIESNKDLTIYDSSKERILLSRKSSSLISSQEDLLPPLPNTSILVHNTFQSRYEPLEQTNNNDTHILFGDDLQHQIALIAANATDDIMDNNIGKDNRNDSTSSKNLRGSLNTNHSLTSILSNSNSAFDLSKGSEILQSSPPNNSCSVMSSPKLILSKRSSNSLISTVLTHDNIAATPSTPRSLSLYSLNQIPQVTTSIPSGTLNSLSTPQKIEFSFHNSSIRSRSSSNATTNNSYLDPHSRNNSSNYMVLQTVNPTLERKRSPVDGISSQGTTSNTIFRKSLRKYSIGSSDGSINSINNITCDSKCSNTDELLFKPLSISTQAESLSKLKLNLFTSRNKESNSIPTEGDNSVIYSPLSSIKNIRKISSLRPGSGLLKKSSSKKKLEHNNRPVLSSTVSLLDVSNSNNSSYASNFLASKRKPDKKITSSTSNPSLRSFQINSDPQYFSIMKSSNGKFDEQSLSSQSSFSLRVRKSFTKIISNSSKKILNQPLQNLDIAQSNVPINITLEPEITIIDTPSSMATILTVDSPNLHDQLIPIIEKNNSPLNMNTLNNSETFSNIDSLGLYNCETSVKSSDITKINRRSPIIKRNNSTFKKFDGNQKITVDIDEITETLPTITITERFGANNTTPIQTQSNIILDKVYYEESTSIHATGTTCVEPNSNNMSLKEYIEILVAQQKVEDDRFAILERTFTESGWCSNDDLMNLKQKRIVINRKWAERISFYQNKLES